MLSETATVVGLEKHSVQLSTRRKATCSGCSMKTGCGQYLLAKDESLLDIGNSDSFECSSEIDGRRLSVGDQVNLAIEPSQLLVLTLWFYVFPLFSMLLLTMLASIAGLPEHYIALCAFAGLALGVLITRYKMRTEKMRKRIRPQLSRVKLTGEAACSIQE